MKNKSALLIAALLILTFALTLTACNNPSTENDPYEGYAVFEVMSFNIRLDTLFDLDNKNWENHRKTLVKDYLLQSGADIVCLQEVKYSQYEYLSEALSGKYSTVYYTRESGSNPEGLAILYTASFLLEEKNRFWLSSTPYQESKDWGAAFNRISVNTVLRHKDTGLRLNVYTVHLDHISELSRENGLALILEKAAEYDCPALLCGDFNTNENSECYAIISSEMQDCRKSAPLTDSGLTYQNFGLIKEKEDSLPIDFCFADDAFKVFEFEIKDETDANGDFYSDHYAIRTKVGLLLPSADLQQNN